MSQHTIQLIGSKGETTAILDADITNQPQRCHISLSYQDRKLTADSFDFFEAFAHIRSQLASDGWLPRCYGASLNVFPSGTCRDMSAGLKAYRLTKGQKPNVNDLVEIFESGPDVIPASVVDQKKYFHRWLRSVSLSKYLLLLLAECFMKTTSRHNKTTY